MVRKAVAYLALAFIFYVIVMGLLGINPFV
jgi:hypothetical protein